VPTYAQPIRRIPGSLKIVELFTTVQGEGFKIGVPSTFVRTGMCNLECPGCDTKWDAWTETRISEVAAQVRSFKASHVVISGGEPTLWQPDLALLVALLPEYHITVESNGSVPLTNLELLQRVDLWSFSPKVGSLGPDEKFSRAVVLSNIARVMEVGRHFDAPNLQIKYVLDPNVPEHVDSVFMFQSHVDQQRLSDDQIFFQPYDRGTLVNIYARQVAFNINEEYNRDLAALTKLVLERSGARFRVVPQLHKYITFR
jgi:organic radical activating enzyme